MSFDPRHPLAEALAERVLVLDGAIGTMQQSYGLQEADYRGKRFAGHNAALKGNGDVLSLTRPDVVEAIHRAYLDAGADIVETNTFSATRIAQADYGLEDLAQELNFASAAIARRAVDAAASPQRPRWVAGVLGPTNRSASISPDVGDPGARNVTFEELVFAYREAARGLIDGGADFIMIETVFDTLNAKAALFALDELFENGQRLPVMVSGTITDASGRTLSGQTPEAFWNSVSHADPLIVGLNCALGPEALRPHVEDLAQVASTFVSVHPNAGLPNAFGGYDETAEEMAETLGDFIARGWVNLVGGCCGTTPEHIRALAERAAGARPRPLAASRPGLALSGLEALRIDDESLFVNVGERTNMTGSAKFRRLVKAGDFAAALDIAREQVENGAQIIDVNMDEGMTDGVAAMRRFLNLAMTEPDIARVPVMIDSSDWNVIEAGLRCVQGKCVVNSISLKGGEEAFLEQARLCRRYGAAAVVMAFDERGQADSLARRREIVERCYRLLVEEAGLAPEDIVFDANVFAIATGIEEHNGYGRDFIDAVRWTKERFPLVHTSGGHQQRLVLVSRQRPRARSHPRGLPLPRHRRRALHGHRQRRPACHLRRDSRRPQGCSGRRGAESPRRRRRALARDGAALQRRRAARSRAGRRRVARPAGRRTAAPCAGEGHRPPRRRRRRGGAARRGATHRRDRGAADGRHEHRRRPVRRRQDVPAAGGEERPRDEAGGGASGAVHRKRRRMAKRAAPARSCSPR